MWGQLIKAIKDKISGITNPPPVRIMFNKPTPTPTPMNQPKIISPLPDTTPMPSRMPTPSPTPMPNWGEMTPYENLTSQTFDNYKIPRPVAYGIASAENGKNNTFNIGAHDSTPTMAPQWDELTAATKAAKLLSGQANTEFYGNGQEGKDAFAAAMKLIASPSAMLQAIQDAGYAGNPKTWRQRSISAGGAGITYPTWADFVKDTPGWKRWIK